MKVAAISLLAVFVAHPIPAQPAPSQESLHTRPSWPTNEEFLRVNTAVEAARKQHPEIDSELIWALIWHESKYDPLALGTKGEVGLGQLMPGTATNLGVHDRTNIQASVQATVDLLAQLYRKYKQNLRLVLAAYNSGEPRVDRCRCVPLASVAYVDEIEENRFFAQKIVQYLKSSVIPMAVETSAVSDLQMQVQQLSAQRLSASDQKQIARLDGRINEIQSKLRDAQTETDRLREDNEKLRTQLASQANPSREANVATSSLTSAVTELEQRGQTEGTNPSTAVDARALQEQVSNLQAALSARNALSEEAKQRIADLTARLERFTRLYGITSQAPPLTGVKKIDNRQPTIALIAADSTPQGPTVDQVFSATLQDVLLRHQFGVDVELQNDSFVSLNLAQLENGNGSSLHGLKRHSGPKWDYFAVVEFSGSIGTQTIGDAHNFQGTAELQIFDSHGVLLTTRSFAEAGAGFSEQQARDAAAARLARIVGDYVTRAIRPATAQEKTAQ